MGGVSTGWLVQRARSELLRVVTVEVDGIRGGFGHLKNARKEFEGRSSDEVSTFGKVID